LLRNLILRSRLDSKTPAGIVLTDVMRTMMKGCAGRPHWASALSSFSPIPPTAQSRSSDPRSKRCL
jgi:hypothetical protein